MNKTEMIDAVAKVTGVTKADVAKVINAYTDEIVKALLPATITLQLASASSISPNVRLAPAATLQPAPRSRSLPLKFRSSLLAKLSKMLSTLRKKLQKVHAKLRNN